MLKESLLNPLSAPLNIIFAGTPDFAAQHLAALINSQHTIVAVYCPPDKPAGRGKKIVPCATKALALAKDLIVEQPINFKSNQDQQQLMSYQADVMVVVAYGLLLPEIILTAPRLGCINVHGSLLPKWRGAAPIQRSLEAGNKQTGVTIMQMDKGLDTGDMILTASCDITEQDTSASLYEKLALLGPTALLNTLAQMSLGDYPRVPQEATLVSYAHKLNKSDAEIDWNLPAQVLGRKIRAYIPWPISQFTFNEGAANASKNKQHRIRVWQASVSEQTTSEPIGTIINADKNGIVVATGQGGLILEVLQLPGKKALPVKDILNGRADWFKIGAHITGTPQTNDC